MVTKRIEKFYNNYKRNLYEIRHIEKTIFAESYDYKKWEASLREKSQVLRTIYEQNERLLDEGLRCLINNEEEINDELVTALLQHIMYFVFEDHYDFEITEGVLNRLEPYIETKAEDWQKIKFYYIKGLMIAKGMSLDLTYDWYDKLTKICADFTKADRNGSKERLLDAYLYRAMCIGSYEKGDCELFFSSLSEAKRQWQRPEVLDVLKQIYGTEKNLEQYIKLRLELIDFIQVLVVSEENLKYMSKENVDMLYTYLQKEYKKGVEARNLNCNVFIAYHKLRYFRGEITQEEYAKVLDLYIKPSPYEYPDDMNFEMRRDDFNMCLEANRYFCNSFTYALKLLPEKFKYETNEEKLEKIYDELEEYICGLSTMENGVYMDVLLVDALKLMAQKLKEEKIFRMLETIMLHRQLPTAIHLAMVSKLVNVFIRHVIDEKPEVLVGFGGTKTKEEVIEAKEEIIQFAFKAGLCHDMGKINSTDIINLQSRKITDEEFAIIKGHPIAGKDMAEAIVAFRPYADIILAHHLFADNQGGYPRKVKISNIADKVIVDMITICDSIDAATDILGRNYTKGKDFSRILTELKEQSGTRYSGELVEIINQSESLKAEMSSLTGEKRAGVYHDLYLRRVKPLALDKRYVERHFEACQEKDKEEIFDFIKQYAGNDSEAYIKLYEECEEKYLVNNVEKEIIGIFFGKKDLLYGKDTVFIELFMVRESSRHAGIGGRLLFYVEEKLRQKGYAYIAYNSREELGIVERFMWINGYTHDNDKILKKQINS